MTTRRLILLLLVAFSFLVSASCFIFTPSRGPLKFDPPVLPGAQVGVQYEAVVTISGNETPVDGFSVSEGSLPAGLTIQRQEHESVARIIGTPQQPGTYKFKVFVWCLGTNVSGQVGEKEYSITVK